MADAYVTQLVAAFELVTELRVPYLDPTTGHYTDLRVTKRLDGHGDGWALLDDDDHAWTGTHWRSTTVLARSDIYRYPDAQPAIDDAIRLATDLSTVTLLARRLANRESAP